MIRAQPLLFGICLALAACQQEFSSDEKQIEKSTDNQNLSPQELTNTTPNSGNLKSTIDRSAYLEDLGFSNATNPSILKPESKKKTAFCLDEKIPADTLTPTQACVKISNRLASVNEMSCLAAELETTPCSSLNNFPIFYSEFPPLANRLPQGRILIIGGIHGDELTSISIAFKWIEILNKHHSGLFHWRIVPMMNPDGALQKPARRTNKNGVDLNRNLPSDDWNEKAIQYWRDKQGENPRRYPGESPASEPETQWLVDEIERFKPNAIISIHAPYGVVDFDSLILRSAPKSLGKLHLNLLGTYPGSLGNYAGFDRNIPVITLELPHAWTMPNEEETSKIWSDIVGWLRKNVDVRPTEKTND